MSAHPTPSRPDFDVRQNGDVRSVSDAHSLDSRRAIASDVASYPPSRGRYLAMAAAVLAIGLMWGFYVVVAGIVHRAAAGRAEARAAAARQVVCSAFSTTSARDLCALTIASQASQQGAQKGVVRALYQPAPGRADAQDCPHPS